MIGFAVMAHEARTDAAESLSGSLSCPVSMDDGSYGENDNGDRAWLLAARNGASWSVVLQDDAVPVDGFVEAAAEALGRIPVRTCCSFYVGTSRPRPAAVTAAVAVAETAEASWLQADSLMWGVAVAMPTEHVPAFLGWAPSNRLPYDERIGFFYRRVLELPVLYTWPCLVDHADGPTLVNHGDGQPRTEPRRAHRIGRPSYSNDVIIRI